MMSGFVYAIECGDAVKLGFATRPRQRLHELNVGHPGTHRLIGYASGTKEHEAQLHEICSVHRIRGEWFRKEGAVLHFLRLVPKPKHRKAIASLDGAWNGGPVELARLLTESGFPITSQAVGRWKRVPADRAQDVARLTGVSIHKLRPDLWPSPEDSTSLGDAA